MHEAATQSANFFACALMLQIAIIDYRSQIYDPI